MTILWCLFSDLLSFPPSFCRASVLSSSLSRRWRNFHHIIISSHNATISWCNNTGSEHPPKWITSWCWRDSRHNRCMRLLNKQTNKKNKTRRYLFLYDRYLYIYVFVHKWLIILYIRLFSYWKRLFIHTLPHTTQKKGVPCHDAVSSWGGRQVWDVIPHWRSIRRPDCRVSSKLSTSYQDPCITSHSSFIHFLLLYAYRGWGWQGTP